MEKNKDASGLCQENGDCDSILAEISFFLLTSQSAYAGSFTYQKDFKRRNGLPVSRETYRNKAIEAVEGMILNELVASLGEEPAVKYFELSSEEIKTLAKAILQRNVMEEKWDGQCYYLRARIIGDSANSDAYPATPWAKSRERQGHCSMPGTEPGWPLKKSRSWSANWREPRQSARILDAITTGGREPKEAAASWIREGDRLWREGDYARAVSAYETAMAHDSTSDAAFLGRGAAYFRMNEYAKAVQDFEHACELSPMVVTTHINLGSALVKMGSYDQALDTLNQALTLDSGSFEACLNRGIIHGVHLLDIDSALAGFQLKRFVSGPMTTGVTSIGPLFT